MEPADILHSRRSWTGDLAELAAETSRVQAELGTGTDEGASVRLLRHYQTVGCLGRPAEKDGTRIVYGYRQLLESLTVRALVQEGLRLARIGGTISQLSDDGLERLLVMRSSSAVAAPSGGACDALAAASPATPEAGDALALIAGFRQANGLQAPVPTREAAQVRGGGVLPSARKVTEYAPASWLRISIDEDAARGAEPGRRARALAEALEVLSRYRS